MFTYLAEELRTGDIAITGAGEYADWRANLLPWEECEPLLEGFCAGAGLLEWARQMTDSDEALLSLAMCLKCCQRLGYFARFDEVPDPSHR